MDIVRGDYISGMWVCESTDAVWSLTVLRRHQTALWETALTWDKKNEEGKATCRTLIHRVISDGRLSEEIVTAKLEQLVGTIESQRQGKRIAYIEIKSGDPETIIDRLYQAALADDRLGYLIVVRDSAAQG